MYIYIKQHAFGETAWMNSSARILIDCIKQLETNLKKQKQICNICKLSW